MNDIKSAFLMFCAFTVICSGLYPLAVTGIAQTLFPHQAGGSFIVDKNGKETGSRLIGQPFSEPEYFWPRPSATAGFPYNPLASGGSNAGPTNPDYLKTVAVRVTALRNSGITGPIPADLAQASASGLDPHISPEAAAVQVQRVARARGLAESTVVKLLNEHAEGPQLGMLGAARVNVLVLNLKLDTLVP